MNDYISREAAVKLLTSVALEVPDSKRRAVAKCINEIEMMPTADVEPVRHGRWINWGKSGTPTYENYGTCSVCHTDAEIHTEHRNYCPNCGAKMEDTL